MNIFATSKCPMESASYLDDKRVVKMCLETAQLLCTAINECGGKAPYKSTHINHPCAIWARESINNFLWLWKHGYSLCVVYEKRYKKVHKCTKVLFDIISELSVIPEGCLTPFPNCTTHKDEKDVHRAYKMYLSDKWRSDKRKPTWYRRHRDDA